MKKQTGITLIALVITIIVLLILAGVTIATLTGDNGLLQKAGEAKNTTIEAEGLEKIQLAVMASHDKNGINTVFLAKNLSQIDNLTDSNNQAITESTEITLPKSVNLNNFKYKIKKDGTVIINNSILPDEYQQVEYIESTGTQYIDTGITPKNGFGFLIDVMPLTEISTNVKSSKVFGTTKRNGGMWGGVELSTYPWGPGGQLSWFKRNTFYDPGFQAYTRCQMSDINNIFESSTGKNFETKFYTDSEISGNLYLFAIHQEDGAFANGAGIRLYGCSLYNQEVVTRNYIPCYRISDNEIGLYDKVEGKFYTNQGTGEFIAGPEV